MELLFLAHRAPSAPDRGDRIRSFHVLRHLAARTRVHVVAFDEAPPPPPDLPLASWTVVRRTRSRAHAVAIALATGRPVSLAAFDEGAFRAALARVRAQHPIELTYVFSGQMAQYVDARFVMDFVDIDSAKFAQLATTARGPAAWLLRREARLLAADERAVAARADAALFVSDAEAALFRDMGGQGAIMAIGNGIDARRFNPAASTPAAATAGQGPLIVFTGQMDYLPNVEAACYLVRRIMPDLPGARCAIVGRAPTAAVRALANPGVIVTGEVVDTRPWLAAADVCVAPLALARGIQNKVLEAMAMARPVVATPAAAEGIDHGGTISVAPLEGFASAIAAAIGTDATPARARVLARYGWDAQLAPLDGLLGLDGQDGLAEAAA